MAPGFSTIIDVAVAVAIVKTSLLPRLTRGRDSDGTIRIMRCVVTGQRTGVGGPVVGDGHSIRGDHVDVKIHQPLAADIRVGACHAVRRVTYRTGEAGVDMVLVLGEAGVRHDIAQAVALAAHRIRPIHAEIGVWKQIGYQLAGQRRLAELVSTFQNVGPFGSMRTVRARPPELAIIVTVVAVRTENLCSYGPPLRRAVEIPHSAEQAGLRQRTVADLGNGMARSGVDAELQNNVQRISCGNCPRRKVPVDR